MHNAAEKMGQKWTSLFVRAIALALVLNVLTWIAAFLRPNSHDNWTVVALLGVFMLGFCIGRWWVLMVTGAYGVIHAIPVYLGLLPGYLSPWGEALWWVFALSIMLALTGLGVLSRGVINRLGSRSV